MYGGTKISSLPENTVVTGGFGIVCTAPDGKTYLISVSEMLSDMGAIGVSSDDGNALGVGEDGKPYLDAEALGGGEGLVTSVNGSTGAVTITIGGLGGVPLSAFSGANVLLVGTGAGTYTALAIGEDRMPIRVTGESVKAGTAAEVRAFLDVESGATADQSAAEIVTALEALTGGDRLAYTGIDGLDGSGAGALYGPALAAGYGLTAGQVLAANDDGDDLEPVTLGECAYLSAVPSGAFPTATQSSGNITLDFTGKTHLKTTTTAAITTIDFNGSIPDGTEVTWILVHTTARDVTFPAGTWIADNSGSLTFSGTASSRTELRIVNDGGTLYVYPGKPAVAAS